VQGIKFQLLHVLEGTDLAEEYRAGAFEVLSLDTYIRILEECIEGIPPELVVHRLTGDGAKRSLIAPRWSADKKRVLNEINRAFERDRILQGKRN
jgi:radical SAM superfamily enzyme